jgi:xanthine dehydrogenase accessory factor
VKVILAAAQAAESGTPAALVTIIGIAGSAPRRSGSRMLVYGDGQIVGTIGGGTLEYRLIEQALDCIRTGSPVRFAAHLTRDMGMCCGGAVEAYIESLEATLDLVIYGAGHVGSATARLATAAGFRVTVVDDRDEFADPELFDADIDVKPVDPIRHLDAMPWGDSAYHLIVTHSHQLDQSLVESILPRSFGWLGMIGSRSKVAKFFVRLRATGMDERLFSKLSAPVGLDIGAETPEEIAVSILGELIRVRRQSTGPAEPLSAQPIAARGGDGRSHPPSWAKLKPNE